MRVAVGRLHFENAVADFEDRDVERPAAEVEYENRLVALFIEAVGERRGRGLVDDAQHVEAGNLAGVLRRLTLRVVEVRGDRDHGFRDPFAQIRRRVVDEFLQDHRADLFRRVILAVDLDRIIRPHVPLDRADRAVRVGDGLPLGELTDETLARLRKCDHRRRRSIAFRVRDHGGRAALHNGDDRIGRPEVDSDHFCHKLTAPFPSTRTSPRALPLTVLQDEFFPWGFDCTPKQPTVLRHV